MLRALNQVMDQTAAQQATGGRMQAGQPPQPHP